MPELSEDKIQSILTDVVESLVNDPAEAYVTLNSTSEALIFEVDVPQDEVGKVVGSNGRVIKGLQSVIGALGGKISKDVKIDILE